MKVESIAEFSLVAFYNTFDRPALSDNRSLKPILCLLFEWPLKTDFTEKERMINCQKKLKYCFKNITDFFAS